MKFVLSNRQKLAMLMISILTLAALYTSGISLAFAIIVCSVCICLSTYRFPFSIERAISIQEKHNDAEEKSSGPSQAELLEAEVARLDTAYRQNPHKYKHRVILLGMLGYSYMFVMAVVLIALIAVIAKVPSLLFVAKSGLFAVVGLFLIAKSLWVKFPAPIGVEVGRQQAPQLFELIEKIRLAANSPKIDKVVISSSFNCSVAQVPRLGPFGFHVNYLELGLPLMSSMSVEHFTAVLAHEMGHLSQLHGKFSAWICHVQMSWEQLFQNCAKSDNFLLLVFTRFANWFFPLFEAYSLVYRRQQEYCADQIAKSLVGAQISAEALVTIVLKGVRDDQVLLKKMWETVKESATVPSNCLELLIASKREPLSSIDARQLLRYSENSATVTDSHPSLLARVRALGIDAEEQDIIDLAQVSTATTGQNHQMADALFGSSLSAIGEKLGTLFCSEFQPAWTHMHEGLKTMQKELAKLNEKEALRELTEDEMGKRASAIAALGNPDDSIGVLLDFLDKHPNNAGVNFDVGERLLNAGDKSGIHHLLNAIETEPMCAAEAYQSLFEFSAKYGTREETQEYFRKHSKHAEELNQAMQKYATLSELDQFKQHSMPEERIETIRSTAESESFVRRVWVVDRVLPKILGEKQHVVVVQLGGPAWKYRDNQKILLPLYEKLDMPNIYFIEHSDVEPNLGSACKKTAGALVYDSKNEIISDNEALART